MDSTRLSLAGLTAAIALLAATPGASAWTVTDSRTLQKGAQLQVTCGAPTTVTVPVGTGVRDLEIESPVVGSTPRDGFGGPGYATIQSVRPRVAGTVPDSTLTSSVWPLPLTPATPTISPP